MHSGIRGSIPTWVSFAGAQSLKEGVTLVFFSSVSRPPPVGLTNAHRLERYSATLSFPIINKTHTITNAYGGIVVIDNAEQVVARWDFNGLMKHWNRKHALAAYIPSRTRKDPILQYQYGHLVRLGIGTDFLRLIKAVSEGHVYYDPGIKVTDLNGRPITKRRNQFRILTRNVPRLYNAVETVDLFQCE